VSRPLGLGIQPGHIGGYSVPSTGRAAAAKSFGFGFDDDIKASNSVSNSSNSSNNNSIISSNSNRSGSISSRGNGVGNNLQALHLPLSESKSSSSSSVPSSSSSSSSSSSNGNSNINNSGGSNSGGSNSARQLMDDSPRIVFPPHRQSGRSSSAEHSSGYSYDYGTTSAVKHNNNLMSPGSSSHGTGGGSPVAAWDWGASPRDSFSRESVGQGGTGSAGQERPQSVEKRRWLARLSLLDSSSSSSSSTSIMPSSSFTTSSAGGAGGVQGYGAQQEVMSSSGAWYSKAPGQGQAPGMAHASYKSVGTSSTRSSDCQVAAQHGDKVK
jgi:hypothetical protein